ncbi:MAG: Wzz/FepE/Etk N-terminal domain-containing protein [Patescibacteria group bacterium]|nr:Wzz/FepE/Etk N-terminal domain-containing protein [Patescibacteria group bacterium]
MNFSKILQKKQTIGVIVAIFLLIATTITFIHPTRYSAYSKILVVQQFSNDTDPYTMSRSSTYLSTVFSEVIRMNSFCNEVINTGFEIDREYFKKSPSQDKTVEIWQRTVDTKVVGDTGIIKIKVTHPSKEQAKKIADGIHQTLIAKQSVFHGSGDLVSIKVIDSPIVSKTMPDIRLNFTIAILFGLAVSLLYINLYPGSEHDLKFFEERLEKKQKNSNSKMPVDSMHSAIHGEND